MEIWRVAAVSCPEATPRRRHPTQLIGDRFGSAPPPSPATRAHRRFIPLNQPENPGKNPAGNPDAIRFPLCRCHFSMG